MSYKSEYIKARKRKIIILLALIVFLSLPASAGLTAVTSGPQTIAKADTVTLTGTDALNGSVTLWIVGRNYFDTKTATPDKKGNYTFVIKPEESNKFSSGEYAFLIQDPGADKIFEIAPLLWSDGIRIADQGKAITNIGQKSSFPADIGPVAAIILNISGQTGVDDIFTPYYFYVEEPYMRFNRVSESDSGKLPDQTTGEAILITGITNVGPENLLQVEIRNATSSDLITSQTIPVESGTNTNQWTYSLDAPGLPGWFIYRDNQRTKIHHNGQCLSTAHYSRISHCRHHHVFFPATGAASRRRDPLWCYPAFDHQFCRTCYHRDYYAGVIAEVS